MNERRQIRPLQLRARHLQHRLWRVRLHNVDTSSTSKTYIPYADPVPPGKFYVYDHAISTISLSTDSGANFAAATVPASGNLALAADNEGHLWLSAQGFGLRRSTNSGASFTTVSTVQEAYRVGFGRSAPGGSYPTLFLWGKVGGAVGLFRSTDTAATWTRIDDNNHQFGFINVIAGDARVFGRVYPGSSGHGVVYGEQDVAATPATLPTGWQTQDIGYTNAGSGAGPLLAQSARAMIAPTVVDAAAPFCAVTITSTPAPTPAAPQRAPGAPRCGQAGAPTPEPVWSAAAVANNPGQAAAPPAPATTRRHHPATKAAPAPRH